MRIVSDDNKTTFEVPDAPTVAEVMEYDTAVELRGRLGVTYERLWAGACTSIVKSWNSETVPVRDANVLEQPATNAVVSVIKWAGIALFTWRLSLDSTPKN